MNALSLKSSAFQTTQGFFGRLDNPISIGDSRLAVNRSTYVRVDWPSSPWFEELRKKFDEICSLPEGWDGYAGFPVSFSNASFAADLLERLYSDGVPPPSIVPGSDGSLQLEWHRNQFDVEIDVLAPYQVVAKRTNHVTDTEKEIELDSDFTALEEWICGLKSLDNEYEQLVA